MRAPKPTRPGTKGYGFEHATTAPGERLPWSRVDEWLTKSRSYWVATTRPDGSPHVVPVWGVWTDGAVWFSTGGGTVTARNLRRSAEVVVHLESGQEVCILEGTVEAPPDPESVKRFVDDYDAKYGWRIEADDESSGIYVFRPRLGFSWLESDPEFPETATRWRFD